MAALESEMRFIKPEGEICEIEETELYEKLRQSGVKTVEYIRTRKISNNRQVLAWIEAKTTFANPQTRQSFDGEIDKIADKFAHSLEMFASVMMNKLPDSKSELEKFRQVYAEAQFQMIFIIKEHKKEWLMTVRDALHKKLKRLWKIWNLDPNKDIIVLNEELAIKFQWVQDNVVL